MLPQEPFPKHLARARATAANCLPVANIYRPIRTGMVCGTSLKGATTFSQGTLWGISARSRGTDHADGAG